MTTGELNRVVEEIVSLRGPSHKHGSKPPKVLYTTQVATNPPTLVLFVNGLESFTPPYRRFLLNELHDRLPFGEVPIRLLFRRTRGLKAGRSRLVVRATLLKTATTKITKNTKSNCKLQTSAQTDRSCSFSVCSLQFVVFEAFIFPCALCASL